MSLMRDASQVVGSVVLAWTGTTPISGTVIGFEDNRFVIEMATDVVFVAAADCGRWI